MKCLIVSDSHGLRQELAMIVDRHKLEVEAFIHCGDSELSEEDEVLKSFQTVLGNCDFYGNFPREIVMKVGELTFLVTHGHLYNINTSLVNLSYKADEVGADIVCYGHSHYATATKTHGKLFINPGSILLPRGRSQKSYAILEHNDEGISVNYYNLSGEQISDWSFQESFTND